MEKRSKLLIILLLVFILITGCKKNNDSVIKTEFEKLNNEYREVSLENDNVFIISSDEEIDSLIEKKDSFVILYGNYKDNYTRSIISIINEQSKYLGLKKIYYISKESDIPVLKGYINGLLSGSTNGISGLQVDDKMKLSDEMIKESKEKIRNVIEPVSTELNSCDINNGC